MVGKVDSKRLWNTTGNWEKKDSVAIYMKRGRLLFVCVVHIPPSDVMNVSV